jgi:hypothetical protein
MDKTKLNGLALALCLILITITSIVSLFFYRSSELLKQDNLVLQDLIRQTDNIQSSIWTGVDQNSVIKELKFNSQSNQLQINIPTYRLSLHRQIRNQLNSLSNQHQAVMKVLDYSQQYFTCQQSVNSKEFELQKKLSDRSFEKLNTKDTAQIIKELEAIEADLSYLHGIYGQYFDCLNAYSSQTNIEQKSKLFEIDNQILGTKYLYSELRVSIQNKNEPLYKSLLEQIKTLKLEDYIVLSTEFRTNQAKVSNLNYLGKYSRLIQNNSRFGLAIRNKVV